MVSAAEVRRFVYRHTAETGRPPHSATVAEHFGLERNLALDAFRQLREARFLFIAEGSGEIVMAPPFAAAPTPFLVQTADRSYFANCIWDAYGVAAALHQDARIETSCAWSGEPMELRVRENQPVPARAVAHFAVPAAHWWDDLVYT